MEWWFYGPLILAIVMFLLMGTIFERRIETALRRIIDRHRAQLQAAEEQRPSTTTEGTAPACPSTPCSKCSSHKIPDILKPSGVCVKTTPIHEVADRNQLHGLTSSAYS